MGIRKELMEQGTELEVQGEGIVMGYVIQGREKWRIVGVDVSGDIERKLREVKRRMEDKGEGVKTILGNDFNARTGEEGGGAVEGEEMVEEGRGRRSKDKRVDREGRILIEFVEERGWGIFNGAVREDEEGEYTFTGGRGNTVIDYVMGDIEVRDKIKRLTVGDRVDSDHLPVEVWLEGERNRKRRRSVSRKCWGGVWDEEGRKEFKTKVGRLETGGRELEED